MANVKRLAPPVDRRVGGWRLQVVARAIGGGSDVYVRSPRMCPSDMCNRHCTKGSLRSYVELAAELRVRLREPPELRGCKFEVIDIPSPAELVFNRNRGTSSMHQVNMLLQPRFRLQHISGFEDESAELTFARIFAELRQGILLAKVLVECADKALRGHVVVFDLWRSLLFLGAGDPDEETLVGVKGITNDDTKDGRLDKAMSSLGVVKLLAVRMLWELASAEHAPSGKLTSSQRNAMKRKRQQQGLA